MTPTEYKAQRQARGTQRAVAKALGVHHVTVARREAGALPVSQEASLALLALPKKETKDETADKTI